MLKQKNQRGDSNKYSKLNVHESGSVWNYSLSPGWTFQEVEVLKILLKKFGVGKWSDIVDSNCLPSKSKMQIYRQT